MAPQLDAAVKADEAGSSSERDASSDQRDAHVPPPGHMHDAASIDTAADGGDDSEDDAGPERPRLGPWSPPKDRLPKANNYVYIEGDRTDPRPDDFIISGRWFVYTQLDAVFAVRHSLGQTEIRVLGDQTWLGAFAPPQGSDRLSIGYFPNAGRVPFEKPGVSWTGEGIGCNTSTGWFAVDHVVYGADAVLELDLRFETRCDGAGAPTTAPIRGEIHYRANDPTRPPGPTSPPPADLWRATRGVPSGDGTYVLVQSDEREPTVYTAPASTPRVRTIVGSSIANFTVSDDDLTAVDSAWFEAMREMPKFIAGYYGQVQASGAHNPARAAFQWMYGVDTCFDGVGWFVIDHIVYSADLVTELDLRFERRCPSAGDHVLHGQVHYVKQ